MTPFLPDMSSPLSAPPPGAAIQPAGAALLLPGSGETPLDFAGLLGVATQTHAAPPGLPAPASGLATGPGAALTQARLREGGIPGRLPSAEAGGRIVPETGAPLPVAPPVREPLAVLAPEAASVPQPDIAAPVAAPASADAAPSPRQRKSPEAGAAADPPEEPARNNDPAGVSGPLPAPDPASPVAADDATPAPPPPIDPASVPAPAVIAAAVPALAAQAPIAPAAMPARPVRVMGAAALSPARGVATQPPPAGPTLPAAAPVPPSTPVPTPSSTASAPLTAFLSAPVPEPLSDPVVAPMPGVPTDPAGEPAPTSPAPMPGTASSATPAPPAPAQAPLPAAPIAPPPSAPAEPISLGAQIESTIAQAGDLREALRSARPALTVQHGDFGAVSLRLEQAAPDQWRAVLASRDPGFIPAVQAALAERAVAPVADSAGSSMNGHGTSQNGTSDQRYGASPNAGQGGSQPYLGHSGGRDGEAAPDHRRASTAAAIAARAEEPDDGSGTSASSPGGLFA